MERNLKAALSIGFVLLIGSLIVGAYNFGYQEKDIIITVEKKWFEDGWYYFNDTNGRTYVISDLYYVNLDGRYEVVSLPDSVSRFNEIQKRKSYMIDTMGGRLNYSVFRPNAYNFREVIGLDSSKPLFLFESCFKCYRIN